MEPITLKLAVYLNFDRDPIELEDIQYKILNILLDAAESGDLQNANDESVIQSVGVDVIDHPSKGYVSHDGIQYAEILTPTGSAALG